jgi:hypothetical protein
LEELFPRFGKTDNQGFLKSLSQNQTVLVVVTFPLLPAVSNPASVVMERLTHELQRRIITAMQKIPLTMSFCSFRVDPEKRDSRCAEMFRLK